MKSRSARATTVRSSRRYVRLVAVYAGDKASRRQFRDAMSADVGTKACIDLLVEEHRAVPQRSFGILIAGHDKYPMLLDPLADKAGAIIDLGTLSEDPPLTTNIFERKIAVGEYFTIAVPDVGPGTFRIVEINELL